MHSAGEWFVLLSIVALLSGGSLVFWITDEIEFVQNAELFTLTYGAIVRQLLTDLEEVEEVNKQLDQM